jgi:hypothetical protein
VDLARQYCLGIRNRIIVSRAFTVYQLADLIINELPKVIKQFDTRIILVSDLLHMLPMTQMLIVERLEDWTYEKIKELVANNINESKKHDFKSGLPPQ